MSDIEKELSPLKIKKRKLQKLSKRSFEESTSICERNTAIMSQRMERKGQLTPIGERMPVISRPITIPTAEPVIKSSRSSATDSHQPNKNATISNLHKPSKLTNIYIKTSIDLESDDDYDEGGFTPRPQPESHRNSINKLPKVPSIVKQPSVFITAPAEPS